MSTVETFACCKIAVHAVKFPHCSVHGILVGRADHEAKGSEDEKGETDWIIVDAFPIFHHFVTSSTLEMALIIIDR